MPPRSSPTVTRMGRPHPRASLRPQLALALLSLGGLAHACSGHGPGPPPAPDAATPSTRAIQKIEPGAWVRDDEAGVEVRCPRARWRCARDERTGAALLAREGEPAEVFLQRIKGAKTLREGVDRLAVVGARLVNTRHVRSRKHPRGREVTFDERREPDTAHAPGETARERRFWALVVQRQDGAVVICQGGAPRDRFDAVRGEIQKLCETMREPPGPTSAPPTASDNPNTGPARGRGLDAPALARRPGGADTPRPHPQTVSMLSGRARVRCPRARGWTCLPDQAAEEAQGRPRSPHDLASHGAPKANPTAPASPVIARGLHGEELRAYIVPEATSLRAAVDVIAQRASREAGVTTLHERRRGRGVQIDYQRERPRRPNVGPGSPLPPRGHSTRTKETVWILLRVLPGGQVVACQGTAPTKEFAHAAATIREVCESLTPAQGPHPTAGDGRPPTP